MCQGDSESPEQAKRLILYKGSLWELALLAASAHHMPRVLIGKTGT